MSTVTLSNPHCAITSAEKPDGIANQAFTTALPEAHTFLTLFATLHSFPVAQISRHCERSEAIQSWLRGDGLLRRYAPRNDRYIYAVARWMLTSLTPTSRAVFTIAAQVSSGKGMPFGCAQSGFSAPPAARTGAGSGQR